MGVLRDKVVLALLVLVLAGSALTAGLALTRADESGPVRPPEAPGPGGTYEPADLVGPAGPALDAVVGALPLVFGYDHRDLDGAEEAATATMTPRYAARFRRAFDQRVRPLARRRAAVAEAEVRGAGVLRASDDAVACLVFVDQLLVEAEDLRGGRPEVLGRLRLRVDVVLRDGEWLVDGLTSV
jgi:hypothetical protein